MKLKILLLFIFELFLLTISCKKKDKDLKKPEIEFITPSNNANFSVGDTIQVGFKIIDNKNIESFSIRVFREDDKAVLKGINRVINTSSYEGLEFIAIDDFLLEEGSYYVQISAFDGENSAIKFQPINIFQIAKKALNIFTIKSGLLGGTSEIRQHSLALNTNELFYNVNGDYSDFSISSTFQKLIFATKTTGKLIGIGIVEGQMNWLIENPNGGSTSFGNIFYNDRIFYLSFFPNLIKGLTPSGAGFFNGQVNSNQIPLDVIKTKNFIISCQRIPGFEAFGVVSYFPSGVSFQQLDIQGNLDKLLWLRNDEILISTRFNGSTRLYYYNASNHYLNLISNQNFRVSDACKISDNEFVFSTNLGVYQFRYSPIGFIQLSNISTINKLEFDDVNKTIYAIEQSSLKSFSYPNFNLINEIEVGLNTVDLKINFNKD
jgi:hypothetical protein